MRRHNLWLIAAVAVFIGFVFVACDNLTGSGGGGGNRFRFERQGEGYELIGIFYRDGGGQVSGLSGALVIPATHNRLPVTSIALGAFGGNNHLTSVTIPNSVTHIGAAAFRSNQLTNVTIPNSVTHIREFAFDNNPLISVTFESANTSITSSNAFPGDLVTRFRAEGAGTYTRALGSYTWARQVFGASVAGLFAKAPPILPTDTPIDLSGTTVYFMGIPITTDITVLDRAIAFVNANPGTYTFVLDDDIAVSGSFRNLNTNNVNLTIVGIGEERTISQAGMGSIFDVGIPLTPTDNNITLTLGQNITLAGRLGNNVATVSVRGGATLIMQNNARITGNTAALGGGGGGVFVQGAVADTPFTTFTMRDNASVHGNSRVNSGGGVFIDANAIFNMYDNASVSGNSTIGLPGSITTQPGGGVAVNGFFIMNGGTISGNTTGSFGGGVYVGNTGTFIMNGGTVYGNDEPVPLANNAGVGASLALTSSSATARYGCGSDILAGTHTNNTIRGRLQLPIFTVSFVMRGGTPQKPTQTVTMYDLVTRPVTDPTRAVHSFVNWFSSADGTTLFDFDAPTISDRTAYAQWEMLPFMAWTAIPGGEGGSTFPPYPSWAFSSQIYSMAYGNGTFIAVGGHGRMARSTDNGVTWTAIPASTSGSTFGDDVNGEIRDIAYGNGTFIAVGMNTSARSTDNGVTWTAIPGIFGDGIIYGSSTFIAVGSSGTMARSTDGGVTWTVIPGGSETSGSTFLTSMPGSATVVIRSIAYSNGTFIAVGNFGRMARSTDGGVTWIAIPAGMVGSTFPSHDSWGIQDITYGNGTFIAVGGFGRMVRSINNGITWETIHADGEGGSTFPNMDRFNGITYGSGTFIAVRFDGRMAHSADNGVTWIAIPEGTGLGTSTFPRSMSYPSIRGIAYSNGTFIAMGAGGRMARYTVSP